METAMVHLIMKKSRNVFCGNDFSFHKRNKHRIRLCVVGNAPYFARVMTLKSFHSLVMSTSTIYELIRILAYFIFDVRIQRLGEIRLEHGVSALTDVVDGIHDLLLVLLVCTQYVRAL